MTKKITLSLKTTAIEKGKRISRAQGKSISKIVEEFIELLPEEQSKSAVERIRQIMAPHIGNLPIPENLNYKQIIREWRYKDYMNESTARIEEESKNKT